MTWSQESKRKLNISILTTSNNVGPGSYDTNISTLKKSLPKKKLTEIKPREFLPQPDLVTPGPGTYSINFNNNNNIKSKSSFFKSRQKRSIYEVIETPSAVDYNKVDEWGKNYNLNKNFINKPKKRPHSTIHFEPANYLDEKGRLIHKKSSIKTENDIGPGYYFKLNSNISDKIYHFNRSNRTQDLFGVLNNKNPSPDKYNNNIIKDNLKIPIKIKDNGGPSLNINENVSQEIINLNNNLKFKNESFQFKSKVSREIYNENNDLPGPGTHFNTTTSNNNNNIKSLSSFGSRSNRFPKNKNLNLPGPSDYLLPEKIIEEKNTSSFLSNQNSSILPSNSTPQNIGPGTYDYEINNTKYKFQSNFNSKTERMPNKDNGIPSSSTYNINRDKQISKNIFSTRYNNIKDWAFEGENISPSPENYNISRNLNSKGFTISKSNRFMNKKIKNNIGPGTYFQETPFLKKSFNSSVPKNY